MRQTLTRLRSPRAWLHGLAAAFIGGGASAFTTDQGMSIAHRMGADVQPLTLEGMLVVFVSAGALHAMQHLKLHPLPALESGQPQQEHNP